jgi:hypothetical protein
VASNKINHFCNVSAFFHLICVCILFSLFSSIFRDLQNVPVAPCDTRATHVGFFSYT